MNTERDIYYEIKRVLDKAKECDWGIDTIIDIAEEALKILIWRINLKRLPGLFFFEKYLLTYL